MLCITVFVRKLLQCAFFSRQNCQQTTMAPFLNYDFQNLDMGGVSRLIQSQPDQNMLLNILIHRPIHNVAKPILLSVLERQQKQDNKSAFRHFANLRTRSVECLEMTTTNHNRLKKCSIRETLKLFQPNPVLVETVETNRTRPKFSEQQYFTPNCSQINSWKIH